VAGTNVKTTTILLDFDDTLSDQFQFNTQYTRAIGAVLAPQYGGEEEAWAKSAIAMLQALEQDYLARFYRKPLAGYCAWLEEVRPRAVELLFGGMGLLVPPNAARLAVDTERQALARCNALFPGVREVLASLHAAGYRMLMASGQESSYLQSALQGAGLDRFVSGLFGPDRIDCAKEGPEFYERLFAAIGTEPAHALVVDDHPDAIQWALQTGARVIQARLSPERHVDPVPGVSAILTDWSQLPAQLNALLYVPPVCRR